MALAGFLAVPAVSAPSTLGPLVELSVPNAVGTCDDGFRLPGTMTPDGAAEPFVAVNPAHPNNIVAAWIQGPFQNIITAASFDGGTTWQRVPLPLTFCSGGPYLGAGDPWLSFAPNGELYCIALAGTSLSSISALVCKSTDGGLHWSAPVLVDTPDFGPDKCSITADPADSRFVYAAWSRAKFNNRTGLGFSRTTDGGKSWEPARSIFQTAPGQIALNCQILVPDGTVVEMFLVQYKKPNQAPTAQNLQLMRSSDKGQTWSAPIPVVAMQTILRGDSIGSWLTFDPDTGQFVQDGFNTGFGVDGRNGNLYAVWEDGRFSNFQYNDIAFSMSADGGFAWSTPIRINQTPLNIPPLNRQAFCPVLAVAPNGTIGVTYYDFRFNDSNPGLPTDYWLVQCHPTPTAPASSPASWGNEVRLTTASFDLEAAQITFGDFWLGDYFGLAPLGGGGFVSAFGQVDPGNVTAIFARRVGQ